MYNEQKDDMHIRVYVKRNGRIYQMGKHGELKDVTDEYNKTNKIVIKENDYTKKENKLL